MANLSDLIEQYINKLISKSNSNIIEIQRNELADVFKCVPSQINYVLSTRFSIERGYTVESRRGGGGFVRIIKLNLRNDQEELIRFINEHVSINLSQRGAQGLIKSLYENDILTLREAKIMMAVIARIYQGDLSTTDRFRADILKAMLNAILNSENGYV